MKELEKADKCSIEAIPLTPLKDSDASARLNLLGILHDIRFGREGDIADLDKAIGYKVEWSYVHLMPAQTSQRNSLFLMVLRGLRM